MEIMKRGGKNPTSFLMIIPIFLNLINNEDATNHE